MTKKLEETFNLPPMDLPKIVEIEEETGVTMDEIHNIMERADKIDAALPQVSGLDSADADYSEYARKSLETFEDLVELGKNVEDRHAAEIFNAAGSMMTNAISAISNKAQKKLEMVKLQINKEKLEHEKDKLDYLKKRHLKITDTDSPEETEGTILATRNDMIQDIIAGLQSDKKE